MWSLRIKQILFFWMCTLWLGLSGCYPSPTPSPARVIPIPEAAYPPPPEVSAPATPASEDAGEHTETEHPYPPPVTPHSTPAYQQPPLCEFGPGESAEPTGPGLDDFVFGEMQVVYTSTEALNIVEWLPGGQRLLLRETTNTLQEKITILNVRSGHTQVIAEGDLWGSIHWLPQAKAVSYVERVRDNNLNVLGYDLRISAGQPRQAAENVIPESVYRTQTGELGFYSHNQAILHRINPLTGEGKITSLDMDQWKYPKIPKEHLYYAMYQDRPWRIIPHPSNTWRVFNAPPWLYLVDESGQPCDLSVERQAVRLQWSPDGRYLGMTTNDGGILVLTTQSDFRVLDTFTGVWWGIPEVHEYTWMPDSQNVVALVKAGRNEDGFFLYNLLFVDIVTQETRVIPAESLIAAYQMDMSSHGQLALTCPTIDTGRICLISISTHR